MSIYAIAVFLHVVGVLGLFASIALEQVSLVNLRRASDATQAREWLAVLGGLRRIDAPSGLIILVTGFYMVFTRWGHQTWVGLAVLGMVVMAVLSNAITARRVNEMKTKLPDGDVPLSSTLRARLHDPMLHASASFRAAIALGIVFNMTVKPATAGAVAAIAAALVLGAAITAVGRSGRRETMATPRPGAAA